MEPPAGRFRIPDDGCAVQSPSGDPRPAQALLPASLADRARKGLLLEVR